MKELAAGLVIALVLFLFKMFGKKTKEEKELNNALMPDAVKQWINDVQQAGQEFGVPADIGMSVLWVESMGNASARGSAGEYGLMQLKDIAVRDLQLQNFGKFEGYKTDPVQNIRAGVAYLKRWYDVTGNWPAAIKAYNQGLKGSKERPQLAANYLEKVNSKRSFFK